MITLLDTTYREGKQSYVGNKLPPIIDYIKLINKIGIEYIELSSSFLLNHNKSFLKSVGNPKKIRVHSSINHANFEKLIKLGICNIGVSLKSDSDVSEQIGQLQEILKHYKNIGLEIRVGVEDAFNVQKKSLLKICNLLKTIPEVNVICLSDTQGSSVPEITEYVLNIVDEQLPRHISLEIHLHNDYGLAAANLYKTAKLFLSKKRELIIDYSMGGIGERNGIVSLGDVFALFHIGEFASLRSKYNMKYYTEMYNLIFSNISFQRDPLSPNQFSQSSGLHIYKFLKTGSYTGNLSPKAFGTKMSLIFNDQVSTEAIRTLVKMKLKKTLTDDEVQQIKQIIKNKSQKGVGNYDETGVLDLAKKIINKRD